MPNHLTGWGGKRGSWNNFKYVEFDNVRYYSTREGITKDNPDTRPFLITDLEKFRKTHVQASKALGPNHNTGERVLIREGTNVNEVLGTRGVETSWDGAEWTARPKTTGPRRQSPRGNKRRRTQHEDARSEDEDGHDNHASRNDHSANNMPPGARANSPTETDAAQTIGPDGVHTIEDVIKAIRNHVKGLDGMALRLLDPNETTRPARETVRRGLESWARMIEAENQRLSSTLPRQAGTGNDVFYPEIFLASQVVRMPARHPDDVFGPPAGDPSTSGKHDRDEPDTPTRKPAKFARREGRNECDASQLQLLKDCTRHLTRRLIQPTPGHARNVGGPPTSWLVDEDHGIWALHLNNTVALAPKAVTKAMGRLIMTHVILDSGFKAIDLKFLYNHVLKPKAEVVVPIAHLHEPRADDRSTNSNEASLGDQASSAPARTADCRAPGPLEGVIPGEKVTEASEYWAHNHHLVVKTIQLVVALSKLLDENGGICHLSRIQRAVVGERAAAIKADDLYSYIDIEKDDMPKRPQAGSGSEAGSPSFDPDIDGV